jgi:hypothetical protein
MVECWVLCGEVEEDRARRPLSIKKIQSCVTKQSLCETIERIVFMHKPDTVGHRLLTVISNTEVMQPDKAEYHIVCSENRAVTDLEEAVTMLYQRALPQNYSEKLPCT